MQQAAPKRGRPTLSNEVLLDKALDLFLEQGFDRTSIDAITAAAGIAKRTVYQRYGDKLALFKAALNRAIEEWILPLDALRAAETDDLEETLLQVGRVLVANIMSPAGIRLLRITNAESARMPEIGSYTYQLGTERTIDYLADLLRRRIDPALLNMNDWHEGAIAFMYLVVCGPPTMTAWGLSLDEETIDKHTVYGVHLFLHGLLGSVAASDPLPAEEHETSAENAPPSASLVRLPLELPGATVGTRGIAELESENRHLRHLLVNAMLETAALKERARSGF